jgi:hypothetical protein
MTDQTEPTVEAPPPEPTVEAPHEPTVEAPPAEPVSERAIGHAEMKAAIVALVRDVPRHAYEATPGVNDLGSLAARIEALAIPVLLFALLTPALALAEVVGEVLPGPDAGLHLASQVFDAVSRGDWWLAAGAGVSFLVWLLRHPLRRFLPAKAWPVLDHPVVAFATPVVVAILGGLGVAAAAGPITGPVLIAVVWGAVKASAGAAFAYLGASNVREAIDAGKAKAAEVTSTSAAVEAFNRKGPNP